ncbi:SDR family NAD(P)-dependent oxidoreductase [Amycolatopsis regifaucium]|uniref:3-oxoacyl-ACP reductase n=1 Tax=Amycolatopsis regifaucium TaxID=546365 RepID=A0A154MBK1_9PSEU|nr:glucose 1-dehydrogenase [Amycolatopsis regifaucium]KZB81660.1 3-oxoacyl-ACP reductase [Amycolatopsis regifaucium]OKA06274.1 3-oxoacyl-ACP reductase [Amycolatopsis regifaucium]SFG66911.1 3-oxoacyl-[acyl-carrier protein] reductase [Amycolatopsis regifaucium]
MLDGKVALVTGGTRGIGLATARALAEAGATVVLTGRDEAKAKEAAAAAGAASGLALDVTDAKAVSTLVRGVAKEHGKLDIVVANAGIMEDALLGMIREELVDTTLSTNVAGTLHTVQAAARAMMRKKTGAIVVLASIVGEHGSAGQTVYAASKAAVANIARSAAKELGRSGIRVNAVAPGVIDTDLTSGLSEDAKAENIGKTPLGRLGTPEDVANAIRFLVSDDASFITGQVLGIDGGLVL